MNTPLSHLQRFGPRCSESRSNPDSLFLLHLTCRMWELVKKWEYIKCDARTNKWQLIACERWDLLYMHHTCEWKELLLRTRWGEKRVQLLQSLHSGTWTAAKFWPAWGSWSTFLRHLYVMSQMIRHPLPLWCLTALRQYEITENNCVAAQCGRAPAPHAKGPKAHLWRLQLKQSGSRWCGNSLPETLEVHCQSEQTLVSLKDQWEWMSYCQLLIENISTSPACPNLSSLQIKLAGNEFIFCCCVPKDFQVWDFFLKNCTFLVLVAHLTSVFLIPCFCLKNKTEELGNV